MKSKIQKLKKGLYIVSTPIGNLKDITFRAIDILKKSDIILCEDTRNSKKLLSHYDIKSKLVSYHKFNERKISQQIVTEIQKYNIISLISDAGTPVISDPGKILIKECVSKNIPIIPIPGVSSVTATASISGFSEKFIFYGFLPEKKQALINAFNKISKFDETCVFFISPKKVNKIIPELKKNFSGRKIVFCREISKIYEEFIRKNVDELELFEKEPKGELTVVISEKKTDKKISQKLTESDMNIIRIMNNKLSTKEITDILSQISNVSKKEIYNYCLELKNEK